MADAVDNKAFAEQLEWRTRAFAVTIIRLSANLPNAPEGMVIRNQLTKAGTSIGANYREANRSCGRADFKNKIKICEGEASETLYWLKTIDDLKWLSAGEITPIGNECSELLALFTSIAKGTYK